MAALTLLTWQQVSRNRTEHHTQVFKEQGEFIKANTTPRSLVFLSGKGPPPLWFYADREIFKLDVEDFPLFSTLLEERARPAYLILFARREQALHKRFKPYLEMMNKAGIDTAVPWRDGYFVFHLTPSLEE